MATIIRTNNTAEPIASNGGFSLDKLQEIVGGYIELIRLGKKLMIVNEEGKMRGLPINQLATKMARSCGVADIIVGDVLVCEPGDVQ